MTHMSSVNTDSAQCVRQTEILDWTPALRLLTAVHEHQTPHEALDL